MSAAVAIHPYLARLLEGRGELPDAPQPWLAVLRGAAVDRVGALTVPTTRDEEWRFTDITPLTKIAFQRTRRAGAADHERVAAYFLPEAAIRLVFVDGAFAPQLSATAAPDGVTVGNLAAAVSVHGAAVQSQLGHYAAFERDVFAALNTAFLHEGAYVNVARSCVVDTPVHLLFVTTQQDVAVYPRCLVVAEPGSGITVVEEYVSLTADAYFNNAVTEIAVGDGAQVRHARVQRESAAAFHVAASAVHLGRDSRYRSVAVTLGARLSRFDCGVRHGGEGADCEIDGLALIAGRQLADTHTTIDHAVPHCRTRQLHKTIVGGAGHAVFNGKIVVRKGAQLTNSAQESRNLLLTGKAHVDTKPQLEILADDVKCAHGATVGQLDADEVFYLRSRGLDDRTAKNLLIYAFGAEIVERIPVRSLARQLEAAVTQQTRQD